MVWDSLCLQPKRKGKKVFSKDRPDKQAPLNDGRAKEEAKAFGETCRKCLLKSLSGNFLTA